MAHELEFGIDCDASQYIITDLAGFAGRVSMYKFKFLTGWGCDHDT
jgi:hypothetical protein